MRSLATSSRHKILSLFAVIALTLGLLPSFGEQGAVADEVDADAFAEGGESQVDLSLPASEGDEWTQANGDSMGSADNAGGVPSGATVESGSDGSFQEAPLAVASQLSREVALQPLAEDDGVPLLADALAGKPTRFVNQVVSLDGRASVLGSFTVDGMTYAVTGEGAIELVAVGSAASADDLAATLAGAVPASSDGAPSGEDSGSGVAPRSVAEQVPLGATSPSPSPEEASSDGAEGEGVSEPVALEVPGSVEHDSITYSVTSIGPRALAGCDADVVRVPASVASVDEAAFRGSSVGAVEVAEGNPNLSSYEGVLYDADFSDLLLIPEGKKGVVRIHSNTSVVPPSAFSHCVGVESIEVDAGNGSFYVEDGALRDNAGGQLFPFLSDGSSRQLLDTLDALDQGEGLGESRVLAADDHQGCLSWPGLPIENIEPDGCKILAFNLGPYDPEGYDVSTSPGYDHIVRVDRRDEDDGIAWIEIHSKWKDTLNWKTYTVDIFPNGRIPGQPKVQHFSFARKHESTSPSLKIPGVQDNYRPNYGDEINFQTCFEAQPITFSISFNANGGSGGQATNVTATYGSAMPGISATKPTRTGYTFGGWWDTSASTGGTQYYTAEGKSARTWDKRTSTTLYARWTANKYTVSFNANGGSGGQTAQVTATYNAAMPGISTTKPTRTGYTFGGWYDTSAASGGTQYYNASCASARTYNKTSNTTLYARWTANKYTVSFNANGGSGGQSSQVTATYGSNMPGISTNKPTRAGYTFNGYWDTSAASGGTQYYNASCASARTWNKTANTTLYARWTANKYTVSFSANGGSGGQGANVTATYNSAMPGISTTKPTRAGYTFNGYWDTNAASGGTQYYNASCASARTYNKTSNTTLYARWTANKYTVSFNANGGSGGQSSQVTATYGSNMPGISTNKPTRAGYTFAGWYDTSAASGGTQYYTAACASARTWNKTANATLYARWAANKYAISFDVNGGSGGQSANVTATYGSAMPAISTTKPAKTGYAFAGWYDAKAGGTQYYTAACASARAWDKASNTTLYARWTANRYAVSFNANGGSGGQSANVTATYDAAMPGISTAKPTRTGYTFGGWYDTSAATGGTQYYNASCASARTWNKTAATTLYARWTANKYTVSFNANGGLGGQSADVTATYDAAMPAISTAKPTRAGYEFMGWYDKADCAAAGAKQYYTAGGASASAWDKASGATLYAGWRAIGYAISYDCAGGELAANARDSYTVEDAFDLPTPTRYGYQFDGWDVAGVAEDGTPGPVQGSGVEDATAEDGSKATRVKAGTYGDLSCTAKWTLRYDLDVPVADPGSVTFEADSLTGQVRVAPGTSAEGAILSYMAVPVALDSLSCEGLDSSGAVDPAGGAPELEAIFGAGSASKVRFTATLKGDGMDLALKVTAGQTASPPALSTLAIPAATSHDAPGRIPVSYGLELDSDLAIPPVRDAAPVARLAYTVSLPGDGA